jgi:hypothetical protein
MRRRAPSRLPLEIDLGEGLPAAVADDEAGLLLVDRPGAGSGARKAGGLRNRASRLRPADLDHPDLEQRSPLKTGELCLLRLNSKAELPSTPPEPPLASCATPRPWQRRRGAFYALSSFRHRVHAAEMPPIPGIALMIG